MPAIEKPSLKTAQLNAIHQMLSLDSSSPSNSHSSNSHYNGTQHHGSSNTTSSSSSSSSSHNQWKILIYDKPCRTIISPLLSVSQLRALGVTLHLLLSSTTEREPIPDVPAVYFVEPTRTNLQIIAEDCAKRLYSKIHIHFVTKLDRALMEEFGKLIVQNGCLDMIASLHDQYLDFICMEKYLFSLSNKQDSYVMINGANVTDTVMENYLTEIAFGLLSVVGTTGKIPVIRCPRGGAPEMVARKLNQLIAEHPKLTSRTNNQQRPLLVILDRNMDLITPIQHSSTYQALIDDLLEHHANRVEFTTKAEGSSKNRAQVKKFDLDADLDPFYSKHKFQPFPEAIEENGAELQDVTVREQAIRSKTVGGGGGGAGAGDEQAPPSEEEGGAASDLASAVDSLPKLLERKKQLEMHTSILQAVMNEVAARDVPQFFELESALASGQYKNDALKAKSEVMALATDPSKGNVEDKIRLVIVFCLATTASGSHITEVAEGMKNALESRGSTVDGKNNSGHGGHGLLTKEDRVKLEKGLKAIDYLQKLRSMKMIPNIADQDDYGGSKGANNSDLLSGFMARATNQATGLLAKATEKVSSMLGKIVKHHSTRVVENLCEMKPGTEDDEYLYLDPKVRGDVDVKVLRTMTRAPCREVITFVIGGGCYAEYQNLQMIADERRTVTYGSTELVSPCEFLSQLGKLS